MRLALKRKTTKRCVNNMGTNYLKQKNDLWVLYNGKEYCVGLTKKAQDDLGKITFATLPKVGEKIEQGQAILEVEAEKAVCEFPSPISGVVSSINEQLADFNHEDEMQAWVLSFKEVDPTEFEALA